MQTDGGQDAGRKMSETQRTAGSRGRDELQTYAVRIKGHLESRWADWFEGLTVRQEEEGVTLVTGPMLDQAALHGLMRKVRDLGLTLLSITPAAPDGTGAANAPDEPDIQA